MEEQIITFLSAMADWVPKAFMWLGAIVVFLRSAVKMTPTGKDDKVLAMLDGIPLLGGFLAGIASKAPIQKK